MDTNEIKKELVKIFRKYYPSLTPNGGDGLTKIQKELFDEMSKYIHDNFRKKKGTNEDSLL